MNIRGIIETPLFSKFVEKLNSDPKVRNHSKLRSLEVFVGAGGLALGTARAGFAHVAVMDLHKGSCETLCRNKENNIRHVRNWKIIPADISAIDFSEYAGIDLLSGGPPCQPFSQGGIRNGRHDSREMFPEFIRAVRECAPKSFLIENVKGLHDRSFIHYFTYLIHQLRFPHVIRNKGEKWTEHRSRLERIYTSGRYCGPQYNVIFQVLNAANFGVPQRRERLFIVGIRADLGVEYSFPLSTHTREKLLLDQWVDGSYWERYRIARKQRPQPPVVKKVMSQITRAYPTQAWRTVRDAIHDLPNISIGQTSHKVLNHFLNPGARTYKGHDGSRMDAPAKTIKAGHNGVPGGENTLRLDDGSVRYFSVRECARLQTFPDDWAFDGSWCSCMRQIGNAVPVTLAEIVATPLAKALRNTSE